MSAATLLAIPDMPDNRRLWTAIGISLAVHGLLLALHFNFPDASREIREKAMDIILVNAKSASRPVSPQALAQANLDGGGNTDENRRATTPLPATQQKVEGSDLEQMQRRVQELEARQQQMLAQAKNLRTAPLTRDGQDQPQPSVLSGLDLAEAARAQARLQSEISKSIDEYNQRPRKKDIGARTEAYMFAQYLEDWRLKVERIGNLNFPKAARGKAYGAVTVWVELKPDGSLHRVEVARSSGKQILDDAALRIVKLGSPYGPFSVQAAKGADLLTFARTISFTTSDTPDIR